MSTNTPNLIAKDGRIFSEWDIEKEPKEWHLMQDFTRSKFYPLIRKTLSYRASEITEEIVFEKNSDSVKEDQGALAEILDLIAFFDEFQTKELVPDSPGSSDVLDS